MKTLKNHTILYDEVCPMCNLYTGAFVRAGMLDKEGRAPYQTSGLMSQVNPFRAVDEIALVNTKTGEVTYGVQSLFVILGHSFPFFAPLFRFQPFAWTMDKWYKFISYNRRVIMPSAKNSGCAHEPSFNATYRLLYILFSSLLAGLILSRYSALLTGMIPTGKGHREFLVGAGQIFWQFCFISLLHPQKTWDYLGTLMTVSLAGSLLLSPVLLLARIFSLHPWLFAAYFFLVVALMLVEHIRRTRILSLSPLITVTWVLYRLIILLLIF